MKKSFAMLSVICSLYSATVYAAPPHSIALIGASVDLQLHNSPSSYFPHTAPYYPDANNQWQSTNVAPYSAAGYPIFMGYLPAYYTLTNYAANDVNGAGIYAQAQQINANNKPGFVVVGMTGQICTDENSVAHSTLLILTHLKTIGVERVLVVKYPVAFEPYGHVECEMSGGNAYFTRAGNYNTWLERYANDLANAQVAPVTTPEHFAQIQNNVTVVNPWYLYNALIQVNPATGGYAKIHASAPTLVRAAESLRQTILSFQ